MPSLSFAMAQVTRLSGLEKFPRSYEARKELAVAFQKVYANEMSLTNAVDMIVEYQEFCPKPFQIYKKGKKKETGCPECDYTGWIDGPSKGNHNSVRRCHCMPPLPDDAEWGAA